jgi:hypothetical protein
VDYLWISTWTPCLLQCSMSIRPLDPPCGPSWDRSTRSSVRVRRLFFCPPYKRLCLSVERRRAARPARVRASDPVGRGKFTQGAPLVAPHPQNLLTLTILCMVRAWTNGVLTACCLSVCCVAVCCCVVCSGDGTDSSVTEPGTLRIGRGVGSVRNRKRRRRTRCVASGFVERTRRRTCGGCILCRLAGADRVCGPWRWWGITSTMWCRSRGGG